MFSLEDECVPLLQIYLLSYRAVDSSPRVVSARERHQIGESCRSDADGDYVQDGILGRLLDDSVVIGDDKNVAAWDVDAPDEDGTAAQDDLHQQFIKINIRQNL